MTRKEIVLELEKRYGRGAFYSRHFNDHPQAEVFFHRQTGFSIGSVRVDTGLGHISDSGELQQSYRIDRGE